MIQKAHHVGLGHFNQSCPVWDAGAKAYWRALRGDRIQVRGGQYINGGGVFTYTYGGSDRYTHWDPGRGTFQEVDPGVAPVVPMDGHFPPGRTNYYSVSQPLNTRDFNLESGLTFILDGTPTYPIITETTGAPPDAFRVLNTTGTTKRIHEQDTSSSSFKRMWSVLAKRTDGGKIDNATLRLGVSALADPLGANIAIGTTVYRKIRGDGWYQCSTYVDPQPGAPDVHYWVEIEPGTTIHFEAPQATSFGTTIEEPTPQIITRTSTSRVRDVHELDMAGGFDLPPAGWMACTVIPRTDGSAITWPFSDILEWRIDASNRHRWIISNSFQALVFQTEESGVSQAFLQTQTSDILQGVPLGVCATWGKRLGSEYFLFCMNGQQIELDTNGVIPTGGPATLLIGSQAGSSVANVKMPEFAIGDRALSRHDCRLMSRWFQSRGVNTLGVAGA